MIGLESVTTIVALSLFLVHVFGVCPHKEKVQGPGPGSLLINLCLCAQVLAAIFNCAIHGLQH